MTTCILMQALAKDQAEGSFVKVNAGVFMVACVRSTPLHSNYSLHQSAVSVPAPFHAPAIKALSTISATLEPSQLA